MNYVCLPASYLKKYDYVYDTPTDKRVRYVYKYPYNKSQSKEIVEVEFFDNTKSYFIDGEPVHVSLPIQNRSRAEVECFMHSMVLWAWRVHIKDYTCK